MQLDRQLGYTGSFISYSFVDAYLSKTGKGNNGQRGGTEREQDDNLTYQKSGRQKKRLLEARSVFPSRLKNKEVKNRAVMTRISKDKKTL